MNDILCRQLAADYCCAPEDVSDKSNHFTRHRFLEGRRRFKEVGECFLKIAVINGKLLFCGQDPILHRCEEQFKDTGGEWFLEYQNLRSLEKMLNEYGWQIDMIHPFFIPGKQDTEPKTSGDEDYEIRWYRGAEIDQFRGDNRFGEAFTFLPEAPDVLGVAAIQNGNILGMAGASADSPTMWQIGINVDPAAKNTGIGTKLVSLIKNEIIAEGILPYYGTAFSHMASQRVALNTGFVPAWAELITSKKAD